MLSSSTTTSSSKKPRKNPAYSSRKKISKNTMITEFFRPTTATTTRSTRTTTASESTTRKNENKTNNQKRPLDSTVVSSSLSLSSLPVSAVEATKRLKPTASFSSMFSSLTATAEEDRAMEKMLSHLNDSVDWKGIVVDKLRQLPEFRQVCRFVAQERQQRKVKVFPPIQDTWTALNVCPLQDVKVVIVGQDPYHGMGQAHGLCFSVRPHVRPLPPSLKNIFLELSNDPQVDFGGGGTASAKNQHQQHGYLLKWAQQGVLLLNTVWTVQQGKAQSHQNKGWEEVTTLILQTLLEQHILRQQNTEQKKQKIVFLLWGRPANKRMQVVLEKLSKKKSSQKSPAAAAAQDFIHMISTSHPSPLGARKTQTPFLTSHCFSRCNTLLQEMGQTPIDWNL